MTEFHSLRNISKSEIMQVEQKLTKKNLNLVLVHNVILNNLLFDPDVKTVLPEGSINVPYRRRKNLKEIILSTHCSKSAKKLQCMISKQG